MGLGMCEGSRAARFGGSKFLAGPVGFEIAKLAAREALGADSGWYEAFVYSLSNSHDCEQSISRAMLDRRSGMLRRTVVGS